MDSSLKIDGVGAKMHIFLKSFYLQVHNIIKLLLEEEIIMIL